MNFNGKRFCGSSRTGESVRFPIRHIEVRILPPQPPIPAFGQASQEDARMGRKSRLFAHSISSPDSRLADLEAEIAESLRPCPQIFPFWGDYRRRLVRSRLPPDPALCLGQFSGHDCTELGICRLDCHATTALCWASSPAPTTRKWGYVGRIAARGDSCDCRDNFGAMRALKSFSDLKSGSPWTDQTARHKRFVRSGQRVCQS